MDTTKKTDGKISLWTQPEILEKAPLGSWSCFQHSQSGPPGYADVSCSEAGGHSHRASGPGYIMVVCVDRALGINAEVRSSHAVRYFELLQRSQSRCK